MRQWILVGSLAMAACAQAGMIEGRIRFEGKAPSIRPLDTSGDPSCHAMHQDEPLERETLVLGDDQTMANVYVRIVGGLPEGPYPDPEAPAILTQSGCHYAPHVFVVRTGQTLRIQNPDRLIHNVSGQPKNNPPFNLGMTQEIDELTRVFDNPEPEPFPIACSVHPWMQAFCAVLEHPFFDVTETDGLFRIENLPPGTYTIEAWHERLGTQTAEVAIAADDDVAMQDFAFRRPGAQ